jgi:hypothetical protein
MISKNSFAKSSSLISLLFGVTTMSFILLANQVVALGSCKNVELTFKNGTNQQISIPKDGHRVKNKGSIEGWNKLSLGAAKTNLQSGDSWSNTLKLNIKCVTDAEFEIKWSDNNGDHFSNFTSVNISDQQATFTLK